MTIDPSSLYAVAAAIVALVGGIVAAAIRWSSAQAKQAEAAMASQTAAVRQLLEASRPGNADASGRFDELSCSPDCRRDVLSMLSTLRTELASLGAEMRASTKELHEVLGRHRVRLGILEDRAGIHRRSVDDSDSTRPGR